MERYGSGSKRDVVTTNSSSSINEKVKEPWAATSYSQIGSGFSWPPRSYSCSFCKREFRSAQALGGHMNVHRRDKARLRQSPPLDCPPFNPNPTTLSDGKVPVHVPCSEPIPNLNMPPPLGAINVQEKLFPVTYAFPFMLPAKNYLAPLKGEGPQMTKPVAAMPRLAELKDRFGDGGGNGGFMLKGTEIVRLDLDLELRLGSSV